MSHQVYFAASGALAEHGRRSVRSATVVLAARLINGFIQVGSILFLARLLSPEDYGLVGMVLAITGFSSVIVDLGTRDAIVQRDHITPSEVSALFWITVGTGLTLTIIIASCSPIFVWFYGDPRLESITAVSALTFFTTSLGAQHSALLRRAMDFQAIAKVDIAANLLSVFIVIFMAANGFQYWALVLRPITVTSITAVGTWMSCKWLPGKPTFTSGVGSMLKFGLHLVGSSLVEYVGKNSDRVAIGKVSGAHSLGLYQNAVLIYSNVLDLAFSLHDVAISGLSKLRNNLPEFHRLWSKGLSTLAFFGMPGFGLLAVNGQDLVSLTLGSKWASAGGLLSILALRGIPHVVERSIGWLHVSAGRTDRWFRWGVISTCAQVLSLLAGLPFGAMGVVVAYVICMYALFFPAIVYAGRPLGIGFKEVFNAIHAPLISALCATGLGFAIRDIALSESERILRLVLPSAVFILAYLLLAYRLFGAREPLVVAFLAVKDIWPRSSTRGLNSPTSVRTENERLNGPGGDSASRAVVPVDPSMPMVSILVPAYNAGKWIEESIHSALSQTWPRKEIIVVDDGSSDNTLSLARQFERFGVKVAAQANQGAAAARNYAFQLSQGDYIQWLDADDILAPDKIELQMDAIGRNRGSKILLSSQWGSFFCRPHKAVFRESPLWADLTPLEWLLRKMECGVFIQTACWLVSRELTLLAGPWNTGLLGDDDGEYFCRVLMASEGTRFVRTSRVFYRTPGTKSLSYIGRNRAKIEAQFRSCRMHIGYVRQIKDDARVRAACLEFLQRQLECCNPDNYLFFDKAQGLAQSLGGSFGVPVLNWRYRWIQKLFGWELALRAKSFLPQVKRSILRFLDRMSPGSSKPAREGRMKTNHSEVGVS